MPKFNLGWLKDKNGEKFAPKTFTTQVLDDTGKKNLKEILENTEEKIEEKIKNKIDSPTAAEVGQQLIVKEVDENGNAIEWEYVERPCYIEEKLLFDKYLDIKDVGVYGDFTYYYSEDEKFTLVVDKEYKVIIDGYVHDETCYDNNGKPCIYVSMNQYVTIYEDYLYGNFNNCSFQIIEINTKQLDESLIPDNIFIKKPMSSGSNGDVLTSDSYGNAYWSNSYVKTSDLNSYAKTTQYATSSKAGLVRTNTSYGTQMNGQYIQTSPASTSEISSKSNTYKPIVPSTVDYAVKAGLVNNSLTWTDSEKLRAREVIGTISIDDISEKYNETGEIELCSEVVTFGVSGFSYDVYCAIIQYTTKTLFYDYPIGTKFKLVIGQNEYISYLTNDRYAGNGYLCNPYDGLEDNGEDWGIYNNGLSDFTVGVKGNPGTCTVKLYVYGEVTVNKFKEKFIPDNIPKISTATTGQILSVAEVDSEGKPIRWKTVEQSSGEGGDITIDEDGYLVCDGEGEGESDDSVKYIEQTLTEEQKTQARTNIGAASKEEVGKLSEEIEEIKENGSGGEGASLDVQINGTSIVENGVASIPIAGFGKLGLAKVDFFGNAGVPSGLSITSDGKLMVRTSNEDGIDKRGGYDCILSAQYLDYAVKTAMCDGKGAEWTAEEKASAIDRIGLGWRYIDTIEVADVSDIEITFPQEYNEFMVIGDIEGSGNSIVYPRYGYNHDNGNLVAIQKMHSGFYPSDKTEHYELVFEKMNIENDILFRMSGFEKTDFVSGRLSQNYQSTGWSSFFDSTNTFQCHCWTSVRINRTITNATFKLYAR